jgi:hypothetical protein
MDAKLMTALCFFFTASPVVAEEVLYCVDTDAVGFAWGKDGDAKSSKFISERHTVKVVSDTGRLITRMQGDTAGTTEEYECKLKFPKDFLVVCQERVLGTDKWNFYHNTYTRAMLYGPPSGGRDPNIWIAYGTCTKF